MTKSYFVTGIDTDIGKTVVTGLIARYLQQRDCAVITHKPVQTGCIGISEDILTHRKMMGISPLPEDNSGDTCPYIFLKPCSPHLAAEKEGREIDLDFIVEKIEKLQDKYSHILIEGAGGLCAPITRETNSLQFVKQQGYPLIVVTSSRLGSLHHSLSLLELIAHHKIPIAAVIYNRYGEQDEEIGDDSKQIIERGLTQFGFTAPVIEVYDASSQYQYDFSCLK